MSSSAKSPQPPLLVLACLLTGWGLGVVRPMATGLPGVLRFGLASLLFLFMAAVGGWSLLTFKRAGTTPEPNGTASALLTTGPFRFSRNPLYLTLSTLLLWFALLLDSTWLLFLVPVLVLLLDRLVIAREETRLLAHFGDDYATYQRRVRRWL